MSKLFIGTLGWIYGHWDGVFYPEDLPYKELSDLARQIKKFIRQKRDVYVYFNNDAYDYAIENAKYLVKILKERRWDVPKAHTD